MSDNNTKIISTVMTNEEEKFIDEDNIENGVTDKNNTRKPEIKGILKNKKTPYDIENDDKMKSIIGKMLFILIVSILVSPFIICDLVFGYTDDSCVNIYPENFDAMNMKIYLLVSAYYVLGLLIILCLKLYFTVNDNNNEVIVFAFLSIVLHLSQLFLVIWNILGAVIFWGTLNKRNICSKNINNYLFLSLIIKLFANLYNIMSTKNKKK